jgi:hypothetical protein
MHRGLERRHIFKDPPARAVFLRLLGETVERYRHQLSKNARTFSGEHP